MKTQTWHFPNYPNCLHVCVWSVPVCSVVSERSFLSPSVAFQLTLSWPSCRRNWGRRSWWWRTSFPTPTTVLRGGCVSLLRNHFISRPPPSLFQTETAGLIQSFLDLLIQSHACNDFFQSKDEDKHDTPIKIISFPPVQSLRYNELLFLYVGRF